MNDCWIILFGNVYNITNFLVEHPGGMDILIENSSKDATADFLAKGHTDYARSLLEPYLVGKYDNSKDPEYLVSRPITSSLIKKKKVITQDDLKKHTT